MDSVRTEKNIKRTNKKIEHNSRNEIASVIRVVKKIDIIQGQLVILVVLALLYRFAPEILYCSQFLKKLIFKRITS